MLSSFTRWTSCTRWTRWTRCEGPRRGPGGGPEEGVEVWKKEPRSGGRREALSPCPGVPPLPTLSGGGAACAPHFANGAPSCASHASGTSFAHRVAWPHPGICSALGTARADRTVRAFTRCARCGTFRASARSCQARGFGVSVPGGSTAAGPHRFAVVVLPPPPFRSSLRTWGRQGW